MKHRLKKKKLDVEIDRLEELLKTIDPLNDNETYSKVQKSLDGLYETRRKRNRVLELLSPIIGSVITAGVSIFGILKITGFEKENVITSKAFNWIPRGRV